MNVGGKIKLPGHYLENLRAAKRKRHTFKTRDTNIIYLQVSFYRGQSFGESS